MLNEYDTLDMPAQICSEINHRVKSNSKEGNIKTILEHNMSNVPEHVLILWKPRKKKSRPNNGNAVHLYAKRCVL